MASLIIISGPPCSGKTTLGGHLAEALGLPFIYKDGIKERLFNQLGWSDLKWSRQLSLASYDLLYYFAGALLRVSGSLVIEANFRPETETSRFLELKSIVDYQPIQVLCYTDGKKLLERFRARAASPDRHPGHLDLLNEPNLLPTLLSGRHSPLEIGGPVFEIDTTDFDAIDYGKLLALINEAMGRRMK